MRNIHGKWIGNVWGTNSGNLFLELQQTADAVAGVLRFNDDQLGLSIFTCDGAVQQNNLILRLHPLYSLPEVEISEGEVSAVLEPNDSIVG